MTTPFANYCALVVDDEPLPRAHLAHLLKDSGLGRVLQSGSAGECLKLLDEDEDRPDWVFLDIRMAGLDGLALADGIQSMCA